MLRRLQQEIARLQRYQRVEDDAHLGTRVIAGVRLDHRIAILL